MEKQDRLTRLVPSSSGRVKAALSIMQCRSKLTTPRRTFTTNHESSKTFPQISSLAALTDCLTSRETSGCVIEETT